MVIHPHLLPSPQKLRSKIGKGTESDGEEHRCGWDSVLGEETILAGDDRS